MLCPMIWLRWSGMSLELQERQRPSKFFCPLQMNAAGLWTLTLYSAASLSLPLIGHTRNWQIIRRASLCRHLLVEAADEQTVSGQEILICRRTANEVWRATCVQQTEPDKP